MTDHAMSEESQFYVRHALHSVGFTPTDEVVSQICAAAEKVGIAGNVDPYFAIDAFIAALRAYAPTAASLEFLESIQKLQTQAGQAQEELGAVSQAILDMAAIEPEAKPKQRVPYYQKDRAQWWKGRRPI
jgi:hypothetical protein